MKIHEMKFPDIYTNGCLFEPDDHLARLDECNEM